MRLARDGFWEMLIATATLGLGGGVAVWAALTVTPWLWILAGPLLIVWLFVLAFFRDPHRAIPDEPGLMVSPADGRVTHVERIDHHEAIGGPAIRISIFLSIFNVHINRSPCAGRVVRTEYEAGEFLDARHPESASRNERNTIVLEPDDPLGGPVIVRQIAGLIARRIVCRLGSGDHVGRGERIGLIKFGSRTDLIVPAESKLEPAVRINDRVKGGATVLMRPARVGDSGRSADRVGMESSEKQSVK